MERLETEFKPPEPRTETCFVCKKAVEYRLREDWRDQAKNQFARNDSAVAWLFFYDRIKHDHCIAELDKLAQLEKVEQLRESRRKTVDNYRSRQGLPTDMVEKTFENFNAGTPEQALALKLAQSWQESDDFGLLLMGPAGSGKSHLALSLINRALQLHLDSEIKTKLSDSDLIEDHRFPVYWAVADLIAHIKKNEFEFPHGLLESKFLILDDIGAEQVTDWTRELFFRLFEHRLKKRLPTIITTNLSLNELKEKLHERVLSRILGLCVPIEIKGKDKRREDMMARAKILSERVRTA